MGLRPACQRGKAPREPQRRQRGGASEGWEPHLPWGCTGTPGRGLPTLGCPLSPIPQHPPPPASSSALRAREACSGQPADLDSSFKTNLRPLTFSANPPAKLKSPDVPFPWGDSTSPMSVTLCQHAEFPCRLASVSSHRWEYVCGEGDS